MSRETRYVSREDALAIHQRSIAGYGGIDGLRDEGLLDSALAQPGQTFDGVELYPSLAEKAARYAYGIIKNHPFADGNKRTGAAVLAVFLRANGARFKPRLEDMQRAILAVADGTMDCDELANWIAEQL